MTNTSNLQLPYLAVGQAQKHVTLNQSLRRLDAILQLSGVSATTTAQPGSPVDGSVYVVPPGKSGADWAAFANWALGYYRDGAWEQVTPREGWIAYVRDTDRVIAPPVRRGPIFLPGCTCRRRTACWGVRLPGRALRRKSLVRRRVGC